MADLQKASDGLEVCNWLEEVFDWLYKKRNLRKLKPNSGMYGINRAAIHAKKTAVDIIKHFKIPPRFLNELKRCGRERETLFFYYEPGEKSNEHQGVAFACSGAPPDDCKGRDLMRFTVGQYYHAVTHEGEEYFTKAIDPEKLGVFRKAKGEGDSELLALYYKNKWTHPTDTWEKATPECVRVLAVQVATDYQADVKS